MDGVDCWIKLEHNFSNCSTAQIRNNMETSDKQKPPSCSPSETFEWHRRTGEKVLKRVDKHDSAEMLERGWLDKCPPADRGFSFERTSSGVIEAHSWQVLRPLVTKALTNGNSPTPTYFLRASSNGFSGWVFSRWRGVEIGSIDTRLLTRGPPSDSRYFPCHSLPSDWGETNKHLPALGAERNVWNKSGIVWDFAS